MILKVRLFNAYLLMQTTGYNSGFLLTEQSRHSADVEGGLSQLRTRLNILSSSGLAATNRSDLPTRKNQKSSSGMYALVAKLTFEAELIHQEVQAEERELKVT